MYIKFIDLQKKTEVASCLTHMASYRPLEHLCNSLFYKISVFKEFLTLAHFYFTFVIMREENSLISDNWHHLFGRNKKLILPFSIVLI